MDSVTEQSVFGVRFVGEVIERINGHDVRQFKLTVTAGLLDYRASDFFFNVDVAR